MRALPKLRILVMGLLKSLSSIAYIGLLLMLLFYLYDPVRLVHVWTAVATVVTCGVQVCRARSACIRSKRPNTHGNSPHRFSDPVSLRNA